MGKATSVTLGERYDAFVERQLAEGHYGSADEIILAALALLEEHDRKLEILRAAIDEVDQSGEPEPYAWGHLTAGEDPFATFTEWSGEADEKAYAHL